MLLKGAMWSWRGCVQDSGSMSKYRNQLKISQKIRKKYPKNKSDILCCHDIEVAVFIVQGLYLNIEQSHKVARRLKNNEKKMQIIFFVTKCWRGYVQCSGSISKYRTCCYIMKCDWIILLAFFLILCEIGQNIWPV